MEEFKIPKKINKYVYNMCVQNIRSAVRIEGTLPSFFENKTRVKQRDYYCIIQLSITKSDTKYKSGSQCYKDW
jgi:hypothetical protein